VAVANALRARVDHPHDERSRKVFRDVFEWAAKYPNQTAYTPRKKFALGRLPNVVAFFEMLRAIDEYPLDFRSISENYQTERQSQIQDVLRDYLTSRSIDRPSRESKRAEKRMISAIGPKPVIASKTAHPGISPGIPMLRSHCT
jgi:hypothetical protein